jgi:hypothetical protein
MGYCGILMGTRKGQNLLDLRGVVLTVLLSAIRENGPISRAALAELTGLVSPRSPA